MVTLKMYDGLQTMDNPIAMEETTMFDLASLTKMYTTVLCIMKLYDEGKIDLDDRVDKYLLDFIGDNKEHVTVRMLLSHISGYTHTENHYSKELGNYYADSRADTKKIVETIPLDEAPNTVYKYSDTKLYAFS